MPTLRLHVSPLQNPERYASLARALTTLAASLLGKDPALTAVLVDDLPEGQWFVGGRVPDHATALLEISITAGTNTPAEKAAFIAAAFEELSRQLAPGGRLTDASYVVVRELPAGDWGYGGRTQADRRLHRERERAMPAAAVTLAEGAGLDGPR